MKTVKDVIKDHYAAYAGSSACCETADTSCCATSDSACCSQPSAPTSKSQAQASQSLPRSSTPLGCGIPLRYAGLKAGDSVLDLGSGTGIEALAAAEVVGPRGRVIGVDMTPEMITAARSEASRQGAINTEFILADIEDLPLKGGTVDVVISNCVINLAPDKSRVFAEIFRVLRPGGRFSISDMVSRGQLPASVRENPDLWACCIGGAVEEETYLELIRGAGFQDISINDRWESCSMDKDGYTLVSVTVEARKPTGPGSRRRRAGT